MERKAVIVFLALCAFTALSMAEERESLSPDRIVSPFHEFHPPSTTKKPTPKAPTTHVPTPKAPTTHVPTPKAPTTQDPKPEPTTAKTHTTQSPAPKPTTAKTHTTQSPAPKPTTAKGPTTKPVTKGPTTKPVTKGPTTKPVTKGPTTKPVTKGPTPKPTITPPGPTPATNLTVGNYTIMDKTVICLMAQMALQIRLVSPQDNNTFTVQPKMTKVEGECKDPKANLTLTFKEGFITFLFNRSKEQDKVYVHTVSFQLDYPLSKSKNNFKASNTSLQLFPAKVGHSYSCRSEAVYMGAGLYLDVNQDRMQAFNLTKANEFGLPDACPADQPDYRVAVAVGVTLLVLIVIVVLAYLLGRRRRTDGYQTL